MSFWRTDIHGNKYLPIIVEQISEDPLNEWIRITDSGHQIDPADNLMTFDVKLYVKKVELLEDLFETITIVYVSAVQNTVGLGRVKDLIHIGDELKLLLAYEKTNDK